MITQAFIEDQMILAIQAKNAKLTDFNEGSTNADWVAIAAKLAGIGFYEVDVLKRNQDFDDSDGFMVDDLHGSFFNILRLQDLKSSGIVRFVKQAGTGDVTIRLGFPFGFISNGVKFIYLVDAATLFLDGETTKDVAVTAEKGGIDFDKPVNTVMTSFEVLEFVETELTVVTALAGGRTFETTPKYKARLRDKFISVTTAGPAQGYIAQAKTVSPTIEDVDVIFRLFGINVVNILLLVSGGQPSTSLKNDVAAHLELKAPSTDVKQVDGFIPVDYFITGDVVLKGGVTQGVGQPIIETSVAAAVGFSNVRFRQNISIGLLTAAIQNAEGDDGFGNTIKPAFSANIDLIFRSVWQNRFKELSETIDNVKHVQKFQARHNNVKRVALEFTLGGGETGNVIIELMDLTVDSLDGNPDSVIESETVAVSSIVSGVTHFFEFDSLINVGQHYAIQISRSTDDGDMKILLSESEFVAEEFLEESPAVSTGPDVVTLTVDNNIFGFASGFKLNPQTIVTEIDSRGTIIDRTSVATFGPGPKDIILPNSVFTATSSYRITYFTLLVARRSFFDGASYIDKFGSLFFQVMTEQDEDVNVGRGEVQNLIGFDLDYTT